MNSIQLLGNHELVFSARHFDAVYAIDMTSGAIIWKLGGTHDSAEPHGRRTTSTR